MTFVVWFAAILLVLIIGVFVISLCKAAARGDRQLEDELAQFRHDWKQS